MRPSVDPGGIAAPARTARPLALVVLVRVAVIGALAASALLVTGAARYLSFDPRYAFLVERPHVGADRVWTACFYVHVAGGLVCLATAPLLLWNGVANGSRRLHRAIGRVHAVAALGWVGPTGLYMAPFAKGGLAGQLGFAALGVLFVASTLLGIRAVRHGDLRAHVVWMLRSYALILSALTFRAIHAALHAAGVAAHTSYVTSTWASLALALVSGELMHIWFAPPMPVGALQEARS
jgi:hypothetical protein